MPLLNKELPTLSGKYGPFEVSLAKQPLKNARIVRGVEYPISLKFRVDPVPEEEHILHEIAQQFMSDLGRDQILTNLTTLHGLVIIENYHRTADPEFYSHVVQSLFQSQNYSEFEQVGLLAPRKKIATSVSSVGRDDELGKNKGKLNAHQEFSRYLDFPQFLTFFAQRAPKLGGGESTTTHATELFDEVNSKYPEFIKDLYNKNGNHLYQKFKFNNGGSSNVISWTDKGAFGKYITQEDIASQSIDTMKEKAIKLARERVSDHVEFDDSTNDLILHQRNDIVQIHPLTNLPIIFSSLPTYWAGYYNAKNDPVSTTEPVPPPLTYGNGDPIPEEYLDFLFEQSVALEYTHSFRDGDLLLLDNYSVYHGRNPYEVGDRVILASFWHDKVSSSVVKPYKPSTLEILF